MSIFRTPDPINEPVRDYAPGSVEQDLHRDARCSATTANPVTGKTDVEVPKLLHSEFGHTDFGLYAQVVKSGPVRNGDPVRVL